MMAADTAKAEQTEFSAIVSWADQAEAAAMTAVGAWNAFKFGPSPEKGMDESRPPREADRFNATVGTLRNITAILEKLASDIQART